MQMTRRNLLKIGAAGIQRRGEGMRNHRRAVGPAKLARCLRPLFWDHDFARLNWKADRDLVINRVLAAGDWESVRWLLQNLPKSDLRDWLQDRCGAGLSARQLRFWASS